MKKGDDKIKIEFENKLDKHEAAFFLAELKNQVEFTKKQIEIIELKNKNKAQLEKSIDSVKLLLPPDKEKLVEKGYKDVYHFKQSIRAFIAKGECEKGLQTLLQYLEEIDSNKHDEAILLNSRFSILENERRTGVLKRENWMHERVNIEKAILDFIKTSV